MQHKIGNFVLTVTRILPDNEDNKRKIKNVHIKRKSPILNTKKIIYSFASFEDFCNFCTNLKHKSLEYFTDSSLYSYGNKYYLVLNKVKNNKIDLKLFASIISEYGTFVGSSGLFENKLSEYGEVLIKSNAIDVCIKNFC